MDSASYHDRRMVDGILIPPGYTELLEDPEEIHRRAVSGEKIRLFRRKYAFLLDEEHPKLREFRAQCQKDTRAFQAALQKAVDALGLPLWVSGKSRPKNKKHWRRITLLIRPPLLQSNEEKHAQNRQQQKEGEDLYVLHFDQLHTLDNIRYWRGESKERNDKRAALSWVLSEDKEFLTANYGQWDRVAAHIASILKAFFEGENLV